VTLKLLLQELPSQLAGTIGAFTAATNAGDWATNTKLAECAGQVAVLSLFATSDNSKFASLKPRLCGLALGRSMDRAKNTGRKRKDDDDAHQVVAAGNHAKSSLTYLALIERFHFEFICGKVDLMAGDDSAIALAVIS
jgi:hypothetical protein